MKNLVTTITLMVVLVSCDRANDCLIAIENNSTYNIQSVFVDTSGGENEYDAIPAKEKSDYKKFDFTYKYAYINAVIDSHEFIIQPIDYVGERKHRKGRYTFKLDVDDYASRKLSMQFIEE